MKDDFPMFGPEPRSCRGESAFGIPKEAKRQKSQTPVSTRAQRERPHSCAARTAVTGKHWKKKFSRTSNRYESFHPSAAREAALLCGKERGDWQTLEK
jgi:hypothetical protein